MKLTRIFSGLHTQTPRLAWAAKWLERQLCTEGIGQMLGQTGPIQL